MALAHREEKRYTYADYVTWPDNERWEIIDGEAYNMSPAPKTKHQDIVSNLHILIKTHKDNFCYTGIAPTDIIFDEYNVVQPDVFVVCDKSKVTDNNIQGAPDLIIEVLSPATELKDKREKKNLYERFGVKEYIMVHPELEYLERCLLENNKYGFPEIYSKEESFRLITPELEINLQEVFSRRE